MLLVHIDAWNYPDPQKIIDLIPSDIRPYVVMNISLSINHDTTTGAFKQVEYGYATAKSWLRTCAANQIWAMIQPSAGAPSQFSDTDLSVYEEFYRDYPNFIGFNYAEQFWGFDSTTDPVTVAWTTRIAHFVDLMTLNQKYGGYLVVSWCGAYYGASLNPIAMLKRNSAFAAALAASPANFILEEKFTSATSYFDIESTCLGEYLSGYCGQYGIRYDNTGWTPYASEAFPPGAASAPTIEHTMLTGQTVIDGPEIIWSQCIQTLSSGTTSDGYTTRKWGVFPQLTNVTMDIFRKILDGTLRIPTRAEVIARTKVVIINDVSSGTDRDKYSAPETMWEGLYLQSTDGTTMLTQKNYFKSTGRYPAVPTVYGLLDSAAQSFAVQVNKSAYSTRWATTAAKQTEFNSLFPAQYTGDIYAGRHENGWVIYNPYKSGATAAGTIPFQYNTCTSTSLTLSKYTAGIMKEYASKVTFYLNNYMFDTTSTSMATDVIKINGASSQPTYSLTDRGSHTASTVTSSWSSGVFTLNVTHNGPVDITVNCAGTATGRSTSYTSAAISAPSGPGIYTGPRQYEAENFDYKSIEGNITSGYSLGIANYTGQGYLKFGKSSSASIKKTITAPAAGTYTIKTRYTTASTVSTIGLYVNGTLNTNPTFTATSSLGTWAISTKTVTLNAGSNTIAFTATGTGASTIYFDNIEVTAAVPPTGTYRITNLNSGKVIGVSNGGTADGSPVVQWTYNSATNQKWTIASLGSGLYTITGVPSGKVMEVVSGGTTDGTLLDIRTYAGSAYQKFSFTVTGNGYYRIIPSHVTTGACLMVANKSTADGAGIVLNAYLGSTSQQWMFEGP